jgi:hypothetical protein
MMAALARMKMILEPGMACRGLALEWRQCLSCLFLMLDSWMVSSHVVADGLV